MSKMRSVELAVDFLRGRDGFMPTSVVELATQIYAFVESEVAPAPKPSKPARANRAPEASLSEPAEQIATAKANEVAAEKALEKATAETQSAVAAASGVSEQHIREAVGKIAANAAAGGAKKAREILAKYNATNLSTLKPEFYAQAKADIDAALEAADVAG